MESIKIGEKEYILKLNVGACRRVEEKLNKSIFEALGTDMEGHTGMPTISDLVVLFWGALLVNDHALTTEDAEKLMDDYFETPEGGMDDLLKKLVGAISFIKVQPNA